jgi:hypothetical protein
VPILNQLFNDAKGSMQERDLLISTRPLAAAKMEWCAANRFVDFVSFLRTSRGMFT